jgi:hypothetical protein
VEVAHEALLRQWQPLHEAIEIARGRLRLRSELERLAADWEQGQRDESYLLRGARLATFDRWASEHSGELGPLERDFIEASRLVERMVEETSGGDALPLVAYTLRELSQRAGSDSRVTMADYEAVVGGMVGALQRRADRVADELGRRGQGRLVVPTLVKLATVEGEGEPTRRRVRRTALDTNEKAVVDAFVDAGLITSSMDADGETVVEVAHEALLRRWQPLREAIETAFSWLRLRSQLERLAADWEQAQRDDSYLLRGVRLATFDRWADENSGELGPRESKFLEASRALANLEFAAVRRRNRLLIQLAAGLVVLLIVALVASAAAYRTIQ